MKDENYFEKKLEIAKDNLVYTESQLEHFDIQIKRLTEVYEYNLNNYNIKVKRLQEIKATLEKQIPSLEKKIEEGYQYLDQRSGKSYKSYMAWHKADLKQKAEESEKNYLKFKRAYELKKRKKELPRPVVEAPEGEVIESQKERELRLLREKLDKLNAQREELEATKKKESESIAEPPEPETIPEPVIFESDMTVIIEEKKEIADEMRKVAADMNGETKELEWLLTTHQDWIERYNVEEGGNAVWQGRITNGFKVWLETKGLKLGE
jgi:hypothetical protein